MSEKTDAPKPVWLGRLKEVSLIFVGALSLYLLLALVSFEPSDRGWSAQNMGDVQNAAGPVGAFIADFSFSFLGYFAYTAPFLFCYAAFGIYRQWHVHAIKSYGLIVMRVIGAILTFITGSSLASMLLVQYDYWLPQGAGGIVGNVVSMAMLSTLGSAGTLLVLSAGLLIGLNLFLGVSWFSLIRQGIKRLFAALRGSLSASRALGEKAKSLQNHASAHLAQAKDRRTPKISVSDLDQPSVNLEALAAKQPAAKGPALVKPTDQHATPQAPDAGKAKRGKKPKKVAPGNIPSLDLLDQPDVSRNTVSQDQLNQMARLLEERLGDFGVNATVAGASPGPVVTRFELDLAPGVKVSKLTGLSKDLARSLSVISVRIVEVIPGKTFVGLEIPNEKREMVRLKSVLADQGFQTSESPLTMGLGKDIAGDPVVVNLAKMPHLLVAGTTGSGKSVGVNAMLVSMLLKADPEQLRLIMIDPKMLELSVYEDIPHLLTPVVTDMREAANSLRWCVKEMDRRYQLMAALGVRNIAGLNEKIHQLKAQGEELIDPVWLKYHPGHEADAPAVDPLPHIVVVVDEFADMMMVVGKKVEELIARLAQKARAAGIHLILATQRPSVDVITGLIKANIPTRMAFQVSSKIDSRTIIDQQGAEALLGHGDMLYLPPGSGVPVRVHGAFVADHEVHAVADAWRATGSPDYIESILETNDEDDGGSSGGSDSGGEQDALYDEAVQIVMETQRASISGVQRRLKIGYNRAARLIEDMERAGIVSEPSQSGSRDVLVPVRE